MSNSTTVGLIDTTNTDTNVSVLTRIVITAHVNKRAVSSELSHLPELSLDAENQPVTHAARRFERSSHCPVATATALFQRARIEHPRVPCELRFA